MEEIPFEILLDNIPNEIHSSPKNTLYGAVKDRDLVTINRILKQNDTWKATDNNGDTVLHLVFSKKDQIVDEQPKIIQILERFLDKGLSINIKNLSGKSILYLAVENRLRDVIDFLVKRGADLNVRDQNGNSIVHFLIEDQYMRYFVSSSGCMLSLHDNRHDVEYEDVDFMTFLLMKNINVDCKNNNGMTPLDLAISRNLQHVMPILIRHMKDVTYVDKLGRTVIEVFFSTKESARSHFMSTVMDVEQLFPTYSANYRNRYQIDTVKFLLKKGVSVDHVNNEGDTLVHKFLKTYIQSQETIRCMIKRYTNVNHQDKNGNTALHLVIVNSGNYLWNHKRNTDDFVRMLLTKGTDIHRKNYQGETAVRLAVRFKQIEILEALIRCDADLTPSRNGGNLLFELSRKKISIIDDRSYAPMVDILARAGNNVNEVEDDRTPLLNACADDYPFVALKLIKNGAKVNYTDKNRNTPLHMVSSTTIDNENLIKALVKAGGDVNAKNSNGDTPLHLASTDKYAVIKTLLDLGADVEASNEQGRLPLHEVIKDLNPEGIQAMMEFGANINDDNVLKEVEDIEEKMAITIGDIYTLKKCEDTIKCLAEHWFKLKAANLHGTDDFAVYGAIDDYQQFFDECHKEVETLKAYRVDDQFTLYNLLQMDVRFKSVLIANKEALNKLVKSPSLVKSFPNYHTLITAHYYRAVVRYPLLEPAKRAWYHLTKIDLPNICVERILAHMKNEELRLMAEEEKDINYLKRSNHVLSDDVAKKLKLM